MKRRHRGPAQPRLQELAVILHHAGLRADHGLYRRRAESDHHLRVDEGELGLEPGRACLELLCARGLVDAPLALRLPLEVLDDVGDVGVAALDFGLLQRLVQDPPGWADERMALDVLAVAGLLADQHQPCPLEALPEDGLGPGLPERAGPAARRGLAKG